MGQLLNNATEPLDIFWEPYYAEIVGQAIIRYPVDNEFLQELRDRLPLALVEAVRYLKIPAQDYHWVIIEKLKNWIDHEVVSGSISKTMLDTICWSLAKTDSPVVLEITEEFSTHPFILLARFRNGCVESGIRYFTSPVSSPEDVGSLFDEVWEQVRRYYKSRVLAELRQILESHDVTDTQRNSALELAGFLEFSELEDAIEVCWRLATEKPSIILRMTWAAIRICSIRSTKLLNSLVKYWSKLSTKKSSYKHFWFELPVEELGYMLGGCTNSNVVTYFIGQCFKYKSLRRESAALCQYINRPETIEFIFSSIANLKRVGISKNKLLPWKDALSRLCGHLGHECLFGRQKLSQSLMTRLEAWWQVPQGDNFLQEKAFSLWFSSVDENQIGILRTISPDSSFFYSAVRKRAELGDRSVIEHFLLLLPTEINLFSVAHHIWCDDLLFATQHCMQALQNITPTDCADNWQSGHSEISHLLTRIPAKQAEELLANNWEHLKYSPPFIQAALYIDSPECLEMATSSINEHPSNAAIFKFISYTFGVSDDEMQRNLTMRHLERLLPYLDRIDQLCLGELAEACQEMGISEWGERHLSTFLDKETRKLCYPSNEDLLIRLGKFATDRYGESSVTPWLEKFDKYQGFKGRLLNILSDWLSLHSTLRSLQIAAACIQAIGRRKDLSILDECVIEGSPDEIAKIKANTQFAVYRRTLE